jgi:ABC-2 type transport system permease protein
MVLRYLIEKEFKQIIRNIFLPKVIIFFPLMVILVFPWAANQEITNIKVDIVDRDHSTYSKQLTGKIAASKYFDLVAVSNSNEEALSLVEEEQADLILEIHPDFEKDLITSGVAGVMISVNTVNIMKGGLGFNYMSGIIGDFSGNIREEWIQNTGNSALPVIRITPQGWFNTFMDYKNFMIPALMVILMTLICGFLPALNIVSEKETGTIEQINVTPVRRFDFILSKLIPYWVIGTGIFSVCLGLAALIYGLIPAGNLFTIYLSALVYILVVSGLGLIISNYSSTLQQAMFLIFFFLIILIMISGLFTPIASMPDWAQTFTLFNPLRYFIEIMRMAYLKGSNILQLTNQLSVLLIFAVILNTWAIISYRKNK